MPKLIKSLIYTTIMIAVIYTFCLSPRQTLAQAPVFYFEDFESFTGSGFVSAPAAGQLNSNIWRGEGFSDGDSTWGGTSTTGDFARGTSNGGVGTGGVYAFDTGSGNIVLGVQPGGSDFTPGTFTLRVENTTGTTITGFDIAYDIWNLNDQDRANSFNFSYSIDDSNYTVVPALDFTSPEAEDLVPTWVKEYRTTKITNLSIPNGGFFYVQWIGDDVGGSGFRDEFGLDNVTIEPLTYRTINLDGNFTEEEWGNGLGTVNDTTFGITWDDDFWYFGVRGGFSNTDLFMIGIDQDPQNETPTNSGGTTDRCGATFPTENKPDYILVNRQNTYLIESWGWNGGGWDTASFNPSEPVEYDFSGGGGDYEVKLKKSTVFGSNEDTRPVGFYLWLSNGFCQFFNAWPPENSNGSVAGSQFLFAHTRLATTDADRLPRKYNSRIAWAANTLSDISTTYNYFGVDDAISGNPWVSLSTTSTGAGGVSCNVRAKLVGNNAFVNHPFTGINRFVDFTLTGCTNLEVDVQMRYETAELNGVDEDNSSFYRCASAPCSAAWVPVNAPSGIYSRDTANNNLSLTNVPQSQFSFWTISDANSPTAVSLQSFTGETSAAWTALFVISMLLLLGSTLFIWQRKRQ